MPVPVSIVMRSKNSDWVIAQALTALFSQEYQDFELLVVDSGSTDRTLEIVEQFPCRLIRIEAKNYYPGVVLNMAIEQCSGKIIVFQNSDAVPLCRFTLGRLVQAFNDPDVHAAFGRQIPRPEADGWVRRDYDASFPDAEKTPPWITLSLPLAAIRRSTWEKHPFYQDAWASEDTEWGAWARKNGYHIQYVKDAILMHSHNYTLRQIYGRRFVEGEADAIIYRDRESILDVISRSAISIMRDSLIHLGSGEFIDLMKLPARRFLYHWAHYRGHQLGRHRLETNDSDVSKGQKIILDRYDDKSRKSS